MLPNNQGLLFKDDFNKRITSVLLSQHVGCMSHQLRELHDQL